MCIEFENHWRGHFPLFLERMVYIPLSISIMLLVGKLFSRSEERGARSKNSSWVCKVITLLHSLLSSLASPLTFLGGISLEIYLVHAQFVLRYLTPLKLGYCPTMLLLLVISIPLAWLLSKLVGLINRFILNPLFHE